MAWEVGFAKKFSAYNKNKCKKFGYFRSFSKNPTWFDCQWISNSKKMTEKFIICLYFSIFNSMLVFRNNPFSTKLTANQKKIELAVKKLDFDTAKPIGNEQITSDFAPVNLNFRLVVIV